MSPVDAYIAERDRHGRAVQGGCRCGARLEGAALAGHIVGAVTAASRAYTAACLVGR